MAKIFEKISLSKPKKNVFDLSHERKMSMNMGDLTPCLLQEVIPGDQFRVKQEHLVRLQALVAPMMHRVDVYTHYYFVPYRLIWNEWEDFITGGEDGRANPVFPQITVETQTVGSYLGIGSLADYLGFPASQTEGILGDVVISALPFRAYQLIYNEYYRDQNLSTKVPISKSSGITEFDDFEQVQNLMTMRKRAYEKDYFTSALPFAQKGDQLKIPITGNAPVKTTSGIDIQVDNLSGTPYEARVWANKKMDDPEDLEADLSQVNASTINDLRKAFSIQRWLEKNARGGSRYAEHVLNFFGERVPDYRIQRPEYLGGGKSPVIISEVLQQSQTTEDSPQGTMSGHGISVGGSNTFKQKFTEHGLVIGIMSVLPRTAYFQGLPKIFSKTDKFDYFFPEFAHIGEQAVKNKEIYLTDSENENEGTFGYQPRYAEYRFMNDTVHGDFTKTLLHWHMSRQFASRPALNNNFVSTYDINAPNGSASRVFATDPSIHGQHLLVQTYTKFKAIRPLPLFSNPY